MKSDLKAAIARREKLSEEIEKLDQLIALWSWWDDLDLPDHVSGPAQEDSRLPVSESRKSGTEGGHASPAEVGHAAREVLLEVGRPLRRGALLEALLARGVKIGGTDKSKVLGTTIWRDGTFVNLSGWGYWLKDQPYLAAGYKGVAETKVEADPFADLLG